MEQISPLVEVADPQHADAWRLFSPKLGDDGKAYRELLRAATLREGGARDALLEIASKSEVATGNGLALRASALLLSDLLGLGWHAKRQGHWLMVAPPALDKASTRKQLLFGRDDQLNEPATRRFIRQLERPHRTSQCLPVQSLVASGRALAQKLTPVAAAPREHRAELLAAVCRPYLQLVNPEERDRHTGIRLMDIWRYFRHTWANRYRTTPGRNLFYLVRDAAQEHHPVMAIVALGNAVMQLTCRDESLGWTVTGLVEQIRRGVVTDEEVVAALRARVEDDYRELFIDDLDLPEQIPSVVDHELLDRLRYIESAALEERVGRLASDGISQAPKIEDVTKADLRSLALTPLFRAKRARAARELLRAYQALESWSGTVEEATQDPELSWTLEQGLRQLKKQFSATAMMEITVCGAVAPYNELLGGKLACLLMMSPQVREDLERRYGGEYSIIASQMAARPVSKAPTLVFLGTTSLYGTQSSQYNRVSLPAGAIRGQAVGVQYRELGASVGFGSPNLSRETEAALDALLASTRGYRNVNYVFGEGQSAKLRSLREGLSKLGLDRADLLRHESKRLVYGVELAANTQRYLLGVDREPEYAVPPGASSEEIASFWRQRWLASRLDHKPALERLSCSRPIDLLVWSTMPRRTDQTDLLTIQQRGVRPMASPAAANKLAYIRQLYRDESAYSDHVALSLLRELHVKTGLEETIEDSIKAGTAVVITGNAGDGKTHVIRMLEATLKRAGAEIIRDASEHPAERVMQLWAEAHLAGRPICIAINEGPLIDLIKSYSKEHPWLLRVRQDLLSLVRYEPIKNEKESRNIFKPVPGQTIIIDLSYRRTLSASLVKPVIAKLVEDRWYEACAECPARAGCAVSYNRSLLAQPEVQERVSLMLEQVSARGHRSTFRELLGFGSFLIFGGQGCEEHVRQGTSESLRYYNNAFSGHGDIFDGLGRGLDPVLQTHAHVDERLWRGDLAPSQLRGHSIAHAVVSDLDDIESKDPSDAIDRFHSLKRRWFFEHPEGRLLHSTEPERVFDALLNPQHSEQSRVGRVLALLNRWWNSADRDLQEHLRLWTRLSFTPRPRNQAMVSGREVASLRLTLLRPRLAPELEAALGKQAAEYVLLAPPDAARARYAALRIDRALIAVLLAGGTSQRNSVPERRVLRFNDALAQQAEPAGSIRKIEIVDPLTTEHVWLRVDVSQRRFDSAER